MIRASRAPSTSTSSRPTRARGVRPEPKRRHPVAEPRAPTIAWIGAFVGIPLVVLALFRVEDASAYPACCCCCCSRRSRWRSSAGFDRPLASCIAFVLADWFFIDPPHTLRFAHAGDALALVVFVAVSAWVSGLVDSLATRSRARGARRSRGADDAGVGDSAARRPGAGPSRHELRLTLALHAVAVLHHGDGWRIEASAGEPIPGFPDGSPYAASWSAVPCSSCRAAPARRGPSLLSAFAAQLRSRRRRSSCRPRPPRRRGSQRPTTCGDALLARCPTICADRWPTSRRPRPACSATTSSGRPTSCDRSRRPSTTKPTGSTPSSATSSTWAGSSWDARRADRAVPVDEVVYSALASLSADVAGVDLDVPDDLPRVAAEPGPGAGGRQRRAQRAGWAPRGAVRVEAAAVTDRVVTGWSSRARHPYAISARRVSALPAARRRRSSRVRRRRARPGRDPGVRRGDG